MDNLIHMSKREVKKFDILSRLLSKEMKGEKASELLSLSMRQVRRLKKRVEEKGAVGLVHQLRGKKGNRALGEAMREKIQKIVVSKYSDFGPTLACEKLTEQHEIFVDVKTVRKIMIENGIWIPRRTKRCEAYRAWRERKECFGEMIQFDGSYHLWFEGRGGEACLLASIDDATGTIPHAMFVADEGVFPVFSFWYEYVRKIGIPHSIYLDKFSTYHMNHKEAQHHPDVLTQFQRAAKDLTIELISANSPQAKGRVERLFQTLQDRLVKELRLEKISTVEQANVFLQEVFLPKFNARFKVSAKKKNNLHRTINTQEKKSLLSYFSRQTERVVQNDFTISFRKQWYQLTDDQAVTVTRKSKVTVEERMDESVMIRYEGKYLHYKILPLRSIKNKNKQTPWVLPAKSQHMPTKPPPNHPWRKFTSQKINKNSITQ